MADAKSEQHWNLVVKELIEIVGDLARLSSAAAGQREVVARIEEGARHIATAASMALPLSTLGRAEAL